MDDRDTGHPRGALPASDQRIVVCYHLTCTEGEDPHAKLHDIALEQTVELPDSLVPEAIQERIVGRVEALEPLADLRWYAQLSFNTVTVGDDLPQFLNLLFGNISMKAGIRITRIGWPQTLLQCFGGPRFGVSGLRGRCAVRELRPLICAALKPMGLNARALSELCFQFALGGVDIIKDDHGLANQSTAPFAERVERCQEAVARANHMTGGNSLYFPNVTTGMGALPGNLDIVRAAGCRGVLVSPLLVGLDTVRWMAQHSDLALLAHPSLTGAFFGPEHGITPELLLGEIFRIIGSDGVIYPNVGGRFSFSEHTCIALNANLLKPLGPIRPAFPVVGGGISVERLPYWIERYGIDTMFLIGGSLYAQGNVQQAATRLLAAVRQHCERKRLESS
jgi:Ribulose 1,5-bisphosphate carboxylase, large subunit